MTEFLKPGFIRLISVIWSFGGEEYTTESIIDELFFSRFAAVGVVLMPEE